MSLVSEPKTNGQAGMPVAADEPELSPMEVYGPMVSAIVNRMGITHLLDYGCGEEVELAKALRPNHKLTYQAYDPKVEKYAKPPFPAQLVACVDVLEAGDGLDRTLDELKRLTEGVIFLTFEGDIREWLPKFWDRWDIQTVQQVSDKAYVVIGISSRLIENERGEKIA